MSYIFRDDKMWFSLNIYLRLGPNPFSNRLDMRCERNREDKNDSNILAIATDRKVLSLLREGKLEK